MTTETKKLEWETEVQPYELSVTLNVDSELRLNVAPASKNGEIMTWHYFQLHFGRIIERPVSDGLNLWPREAIEIARQKLDALEAQLDAAK